MNTKPSIYAEANPISILDEEMLSHYTTNKKSLVGDMDKRSVQYIQSLTRQVSIKRITAVASIVATVACVLIFQQPVLLLGLSIPAFCLVTGLRQQRSIESFNMCQYKKGTCVGLFQTLEPIFKCVSNAYTHTFSEDMNEEEARAFLPKLIAGLRTNIEKLSNNVNGLDSKFQFDALKAPLTDFLTTMNKIEEKKSSEIENIRQDLEE